MKVPLSWLNEYVKIDDLTPQAIADKLTFSGIEVEAIEELGARLDEKFVVGEVRHCEQHHNADRLRVCQVYDGNAEWQVVCGAPNVRTGLKVAFAKIGAVVPEGNMEIRKVKLRGVESSGMICSGRELKLSEDHTGIMELDPQLVPGTPLGEVLPGLEVVLDLEVTWNRPDCLSMIGIARELAVLLQRELHLPHFDLPASSESADHQIKVAIENGTACQRYIARVICGLEASESPAWMQQRLEHAGIRPISLAVDITNYVMLECGQPLHAFDYHKIRGKEIRVRDAAPGESLMTLDGETRKLEPGMLVIADAEVPQALAGIMGGAESEIESDTRDVVLESALFSAPITKQTAVQVSLGSESSRRFERGVDPEIAEWASCRAAALLVELGGGSLTGMADVDLRNYTPREICLGFARVCTLIGVEIAANCSCDILVSLGLEIISRDSEFALFRIPSYRIDLEIEADLIEEVARIYGLDAIPDKLPRTASVSLLDESYFKQNKQLRTLLTGMGFNETMHYSFLSLRELDDFDKRKAAERVVLPNPVSEDYGVLRDSLLPQLALALGRNASRQVEQAALFEIGRVFVRNADGSPRIGERVAIGMMGSCGRVPLEWRKPLTNETAILWLKGVLEQLFAKLRVPELELVPTEHPAMEGGYAAELVRNKQVVGFIGALSTGYRHQWRLTSPMVIAELDIEQLFAGQAEQGVIMEPPQYPAVRRDIAFVAPATLKYADVVSTIKRAAPVELTKVGLFDIFETKEIGRGKRSFGYTLEFRSAERTLKDAEVNQALSVIMKSLEKIPGLELRAN